MENFIFCVVSLVMLYVLELYEFFRFLRTWLRKKYSYLEFFWSVFSRIRTEYGEMGVSLRIQSECRKIQTRKTRHMDTFHAVPAMESLQNIIRMEY